MWVSIVGVSWGLMVSSSLEELPAKEEWMNNEAVPEGVTNTTSLYHSVYDQLYARGYHRNKNITHAKELVEYLGPMAWIESVLDVGCSHGKGVQLLWEAGKRAAGIDIAQVAIANARKWRCGDDGCTRERCGVDVCFQVASATALPFASKSFDAIISTDVLEHIFSDDVPEVVRELTRVARRLVAVKVASIIERKNYAQKQALHLENLHVTTQRLDWWAEAFTNNSAWKLQDVIAHYESKGFYAGFAASFAPRDEK
ncbi:hypothetical protein CTAYLR_005538 [Chrysophaeum taylorii]|uniref:Methyltransferase type 11 domain-containing protein n=1 Tax=Chrysophaeum taylorii TaxID=2483200 RepID=A0AAD7U4I1_9STRA|nr:hypothetical protein CTAYLR_005538 [Chrysophaeum taylorii]